MAQSYNNEISEKRKKEKNNKYHDQLSQQKRQNDAMDSLKLEKSRNDNMRQKFKTEQKQLLNYREKLRQTESKHRIESRENYNRQMNDYANRQIQKETNYKQFFKDYEHKMKERMIMHVDNALGPEKSSHLSKIIHYLFR